MTTQMTNKELREKVGKWFFEELNFVGIQDESIDQFLSLVAEALPKLKVIPPVGTTGTGATTQNLHILADVGFNEAIREIQKLLKGKGG